MLTISIDAGQKEEREHRGTMLTKTKEKRDKVSELLQRKKVSVFIVFCCRNRFVPPPHLLISHLHVPSLVSSGEIFFSDVAERKRKPCSEGCKIKLQLYRPVTLWGGKARILWAVGEIPALSSLRGLGTKGGVAISHCYKRSWLIRVWLALCSLWVQSQPRKQVSYHNGRHSGNPWLKPRIH